VFKQCLKHLTEAAALRIALLVVLSAALSCLSVATLHAESYDPTKPPNLKAKPVLTVKPVNLNPRDFQVSSILLSEQRKVAVINNQVVTIGDTVTAKESDKAVVTEIKASEVTLSKARRAFVVRLPSSQYIKSAVSGPAEVFKDQP